MLIPHHQPNCQFIRRKLVTHYKYFGAPPDYEERFVGACGAPLFTEKEKRAKMCSNCAEGWTHPGNTPFNVREFDREFLKSVGIEQD